MNGIFKTVLSGVVAWVVGQYRRTWLDLLQIEGAMLYLRGVQVARGVCRCVLAMLMFLFLALIGFILVHVGLFVLLPRPVNAIVLLALGLVYIILGLCGIRRLTSDACWMQITQADRCMDFVEKTRKS
jgi:hypothetical protein